LTVARAARTSERRGFIAFASRAAFTLAASLSRSAFTAARACCRSAPFAARALAASFCASATRVSQARCESASSGRICLGDGRGGNGEGRQRSRE
jgi:hypothetical protein